LQLHFSEFFKFDNLIDINLAYKIAFDKILAKCSLVVAGLNCSLKKMSA